MPPYGRDAALRCPRTAFDLGSSHQANDQRTPLFRGHRSAASLPYLRQAAAQFSLDRMRFAVALLFVVAGYLNSCASGPVLLLRVEEPTLSQADSRAVHIAARERLDMIAPRSRILEIRV